jgi:hypothetical protein
MIQDDIIICEETAAECLPYASTSPNSPNIMHRLPKFCIPKFQRLAFEMCSFESADFQMSPSDIAIKLKIILSNLKFLLRCHQAQLEVELHRLQPAGRPMARLQVAPHTQWPHTGAGSEHGHCHGSSQCQCMGQCNTTQAD